MAFRNTSRYARRSDSRAQSATSSFEGKLGFGLATVARALSGDPEARVDFVEAKGIWIATVNGKRFGSADPELLSAEIWNRFGGRVASEALDDVEMIEGSVRHFDEDVDTADL